MVACQPTLQADYKPPTTDIARTRCTGTTEKAMLLLALQDTHWEDLYRTDSCLQQYAIFEERRKTLIDTHLLTRLIKRCTSDKAWVTDEFHILIDRRNAAFRSGTAAV